MNGQIFTNSKVVLTNEMSLIGFLPIACLIFLTEQKICKQNQHMKSKIFQLILLFQQQFC